MWSHFKCRLTRRPDSPNISSWGASDIRPLSITHPHSRQTNWYQLLARLLSFTKWAVIVRINVYHGSRVRSQAPARPHIWKTFCALMYANVCAKRRNSSRGLYVQRGLSEHVWAPLGQKGGRWGKPFDRCGNSRKNAGSTNRENSLNKSVSPDWGAVSHCSAPQPVWIPGPKTFSHGWGQSLSGTSWLHIQWDRKKAQT